MWERASYRKEKWRTMLGALFDQFGTAPSDDNRGATSRGAAPASYQSSIKRERTMKTLQEEGLWRMMVDVGIGWSGGRRGGGNGDSLSSSSSTLVDPMTGKRALSRSECRAIHQAACASDVVANSNGSLSYKTFSSMLATVTLADRAKVGAVVASVRRELSETAAIRYRHDCRRATSMQPTSVLMGNQRGGTVWLDRMWVREMIWVRNFSLFWTILFLVLIDDTYFCFEYRLLLLKYF